MKNYNVALLSTLMEFEEERAGVDYGRLFTIAEKLNMYGNKKLAKLIFILCFYKINDASKWENFLRTFFFEMSWEEKSLVSKMIYDMQFSDSLYADFVDIIKFVISFKLADGKDIDSELHLLNYRLITKNSNKLIIAFASRGNLPFQYRNLLNKYDVDCLFVRDISDAWYNKGLLGMTCDVDSTAHFLSKFTKNYTNVLTLGSSSGGYAALLFGFLCKAQNICAFSPQTILPRGQNFPDCQLLAGVDKKYFDILDVINEKSSVKIFYSQEYIFDRESALRLDGRPNVSLCALSAGKVHNVMPFLIKEGLFFSEINSRP